MGTPDRIQAFVNKLDNSSTTRTRKSSLTPEQVKEREKAAERTLLEKRAFKERLLKNKLQGSVTAVGGEGAVSSNNRTVLELQKELAEAKIAHERLKNILHG